MKIVNIAMPLEWFSFICGELTWKLNIQIDYYQLQKKIKIADSYDRFIKSIDQRLRGSFNAVGANYKASYLLILWSQSLNIVC